MKNNVSASDGLRNAKNLVVSKNRGSVVFPEPVKREACSQLQVSDGYKHLIFSEGDLGLSFQGSWGCFTQSCNVREAVSTCAILDDDCVNTWSCQTCLSGGDIISCDQCGQWCGAKSCWRKCFAYECSMAMRAYQCASVNATCAQYQKQNNSSSTLSHMQAINACYDCAKTDNVSACFGCYGYCKYDQCWNQCSMNGYFGSALSAGPTPGVSLIAQGGVYGIFILVSIMCYLFGFWSGKYCPNCCGDCCMQSGSPQGGVTLSGSGGVRYGTSPKMHFNIQTNAYNGYSPQQAVTNSLHRHHIPLKHYEQSDRHNNPPSLAHHRSFTTANVLGFSPRHVVKRKKRKALGRRDMNGAGTMASSRTAPLMIRTSAPQSVQHALSRAGKPQLDSPDMRVAHFRTPNEESHADDRGDNTPTGTTVTDGWAGSGFPTPPPPPPHTIAGNTTNLIQHRTTTTRPLRPAVSATSTSSDSFPSTTHRYSGGKRLSRAAHRAKTLMQPVNTKIDLMRSRSESELKWRLKSKHKNMGSYGAMDHRRRGMSTSADRRHVNIVSIDENLADLSGYSTGDEKPGQITPTQPNGRRSPQI